MLSALKDRDSSQEGVIHSCPNWSLTLHRATELGLFDLAAVWCPSTSCGRLPGGVTANFNINYYLLLSGIRLVLAGATDLNCVPWL